MAFLSTLLTLSVLAAHFNSDTGARRIILYAPTVNDPGLVSQQHIFKADAAGLSDRQIAVSVVTESSDSAAYQRGVHAGKGFLFVLYGKDGGKKFTSDKPVSLNKLYGIIDSMPMRTEEMRQKGGK